MLSLSFNEHTIRPKKTVYIGICVLSGAESNSIIDRSIRKELYKKAAHFNLRISTHELASGSGVEDLLLELAQKQYHIICVINYMNPGLYRKLTGIYPGIYFIFVGSYIEKKILYKQLDTYLERIKSKE